MAFLSRIFSVKLKKECHKGKCELLYVSIAGFLDCTLTCSMIGSRNFYSSFYNKKIGRTIR